MLDWWMELNLRAKISVLAPDTPVLTLEQCGVVEAFLSNITDSYHDTLCVRFLCLKLQKPFC